MWGEGKEKFFCIWNRGVSDRLCTSDISSVYETGYALRWGQRGQGDFRFSPLDPGNLHSRSMLLLLAIPHAPPA